MPLGAISTECPWAFGPRIFMTIAPERRGRERRERVSGRVFHASGLAEDDEGKSKDPPVRFWDDLEVCPGAKKMPGAGSMRHHAGLLGATKRTLCGESVDHFGADDEDEVLGVPVHLRLADDRLLTFTDIEGSVHVDAGPVGLGTVGGGAIGNLYSEHEAI